MNYIHEMNLFKQWCRVNSPNTSEIVLWYALMSINNELGWVAHFKAPFVTLHPLTGLSERSIQSSRNRLKQAGLIEYEEGRKGKAGYYTVYEISKKVPNIFPNFFRSSSELLPYSFSTSADLLPHSLNINIDENTNTQQQSAQAREPEEDIAKLASAYEQAFGSLINPMQCDELAAAVLEDGMDIDTILHAFATARMAGQGYPYARGIIRNWRQKGILTVAAAKEEAAQFKRRSEGSERNGRTRKHADQSAAQSVHQQKYAAFYESFPSAFPPK